MAGKARKHSYLMLGAGPPLSPPPSPLALLGWLPRCTGSTSGFSREGKKSEETRLHCCSQCVPKPARAPGGLAKPWATQCVSPPPSPEGRVKRHLASWGLHQEVSDQPWVSPECLEAPCHAFFLPEGATLPSVSQTCSPSPFSPQPLKSFLSDLSTAPEPHRR